MNSIEKPNKQVLDIIADLDKQPEDCDKTYNFGACKIRHAIAVRDFKAAKAVKQEPKPNPCYGCQLITDKIVEAAKKGEENADKQSNNSADNNAASADSLQEKIDRVSKPLVQKKTKPSVEKKAKKVEKVSEADAVLNEEKTCLFCKKSFVAYDPRTKYCSKKCRDDYHNEKRSVAKKLARRAVAKAKAEKPAKTETNNVIVEETAKIMAKALNDEAPKKEAPTNSYANSQFYTSPKHAIEMAVDYMQLYNDVIDHIIDNLPNGADGAVRFIANSLSDRIYQQRQMLNSYLDQLSGN